MTILNSGRFSMGSSSAGIYCTSVLFGTLQECEKRLESHYSTTCSDEKQSKIADQNNFPLNKITNVIVWG